MRGETEGTIVVEAYARCNGVLCIARGDAKEIGSEVQIGNIRYAWTFAPYHKIDERTLNRMTDGEKLIALQELTTNFNNRSAA